MDKDAIEVYITVEHESEKAYLVSDGNQKVWIPKSQIIEGPDVVEQGGEKLTYMIIPEWLAIEKELI